MTTTRRLAAILAADVAGYSAAMERDEEGTAAAVRALRREVIEPRLAEHHGRLIKTTGDGFLAEFASPIAALKCALAIQQRPIDSTGLRLRIGLNLGDVIIEEFGDVLGEGVNVAARLEGLAEPGGILISSKIYSEVEGKVQAAFEDRGEQQVKNILKPVRVYAVRIGAASSGLSPSALDTKPLPLPDKPSIAVLPFQNMSGDPEQEYFADGIVEDIITALSRFKSLFVIARNSSFTYKGKAVDIKQVGRELGVRYVLEGSVRKAGGRVRITGQLIDAATGAHLWADKYDGPLEDVFDLQDQVTTSVIGAVAPKLVEAEIEHALRKPTNSLSAYDCYLGGLKEFRLETVEGYESALRLLQQAIELDPTFAAAYALAARTFSRRISDNLVSDRADAINQGKAYVDKAIQFGQGDEIALSNAGLFVATALRDPDTASTLLDQAIAINPNHSICWNIGAWVSLLMGQHQQAIERLERAFRLSPVDPFIYVSETAMANAYFYLRDFERSLYWSGRALARRPRHIVALRVAFAANALLGRIERALAIRNMYDYPRSIAEMRASNALRRPEDLELWCEAARRVGTPE